MSTPELDRTVGRKPSLFGNFSANPFSAATTPSPVLTEKTLYVQLREGEETSGEWTEIVFKKPEYEFRADHAHLLANLCERTGFKTVGKSQVFLYRRIAVKLSASDPEIFTYVRISKLSWDAILNGDRLLLTDTQVYYTIDGL